MNRTRMHADAAATDVALTRGLLADQFPQWAELPIALVDSYGTDHDIYRIGDHLSARMPRIASATVQAAKEAEWLPKFAPHVPLRLPVQLAQGEPGRGYPYAWSVYEWLPGDNANGTIADLEQAAVDLAAFITALPHVDTTGAPERGFRSRGGPLVNGDDWMQQAVRELGDRIEAPPYAGCGGSRSTRRPGPAPRSGSTATCCLATCSSSTAGCPRSSTSAL